MKRLLKLMTAGGALLLSGCASVSIGECTGSNICPIVIYETFPNMFAAYPDRVRVSTNSRPTLVWTFADQSKYKFSAITETLKGDGVELVDANGSVVGMAPCYITTENKRNFSIAPEGKYYRCEINASAPINSTYRYRVRFRTLDGSPRIVDPYVETTGGGDGGGGGLVRVQSTALPIAVGQNASIPLPPAGGFVSVVWDAGAGSSFQKLNGVRLTEANTNADVDVQPCYISSDAAGVTPAPVGRYYACAFFTTKNFALKYTATYQDVALNPATAFGTITRP